MPPSLPLPVGFAMGRMLREGERKEARGRERSLVDTQSFTFDMCVWSAPVQVLSKLVGVVHAPRIVPFSVKKWHQDAH